ncbi:MAG TPA: ATP-binding cassette domain-containing protein [Egibacteraceae bacterium]|nr:ATP-binding cassette domain-containing protein [Egibacteraceae bacterium]
MIEARRLTKRFRQAVKEPGLAGTLKHLARPRYREQVAVDAIDLTIEAGEAVAYVGPNGAGKSTTIKMLTGILVPTEGHLTVNGLVPHENRIENGRRIGVVFGQRTQLWWDIALVESFALLRDIYEVPARRYAENMASFSELLGIDEFLDQPVRSLSLGQRMRAELAAALLHDPAIVYLDEPTIGLDIDARDRIRGFVRDLNAQRGTTVMLTSHDLGDIEGICQRIVVIDHGRVVYDGALTALKDTHARERIIHFQLREPVTDMEELRRSIAPATLDEAASDLHLSARFNRFELRGGEVVARVMRQCEVVDFHIEEPSIEQVIRRVYARKLTLEPGAGTLQGA